MAIAASRSTSLLDRRKAAVVRGVSTAHPIFLESASGATLHDVDGKEYIDFAGGIGVLNVGHNHPKVRAAVTAQLERLTHTCFQVAMYEPYIELAERLNQLAPGESPKKTLLLTTGAEAVENAVKIARAHTGRPAVIAFQHGFHGRTLLALSLTGKNEPYKQGFGPYCSEIYHAPFPYEYHGWTTARALAGLYDLLETSVTPERVAAIIIEPVLGEGGFVPAPAEYLRGLRSLCDRHGIVFICDEIQSGFGRTGKMFAIEHAGVEPDITVMAKSIAAGLPISAVVGRAAIMDAPEPGGLGGTYAGNLLACAAALAVLDIFEGEDLVGRATHIGSVVRPALLELQRRFAIIGDVRGLGAMLAMEFGDEPDGGKGVAVRVIAEARARGLIVLTAGPRANVVRILVPLTISDAELRRGLERLAEAVDATCGRVPTELRSGAAGSGSA